MAGRSFCIIQLVESYYYYSAGLALLKLAKLANLLSWSCSMKDKEDMAWMPTRFVD